jgi:hypothetical protein
MYEYLCGRQELDIASILENLKELTLDLAAGKRKRAETVTELHRRIEANLVYDMDEKEPQREFITQVYVSLDNLTDEDFPPTQAEMQYFTECFEGKRVFSLAEVRQFELVPSVTAIVPEMSRRPKTYKHTQSKINPGRRPFKSK